MTSTDKFTGNSSSIKFIKNCAAVVRILMLADGETKTKDTDLPNFDAPHCEKDSRNDAN